MTTTYEKLVQQFGKPSGPLGVLAGLIMSVRPSSNRVRNLRTLEGLDIQPADSVLEVGFGPGLAVARAAELASAGKVVGILDDSELMLRHARRRNAAAIRAGRVERGLGRHPSSPLRSVLRQSAGRERVHVLEGPRLRPRWPAPGHETGRRHRAHAAT